MLTIHDHPQINMVETLAEGKLVETDYDQLIPLLESKIKTFGKIRWLFVMKDFEGWSLESLWSDTKFDLRHANDFEKIAIVGDKKWHEWMTDAMKPFTSAEVKFFEINHGPEAQTWIEM